MITVKLKKEMGFRSRAKGFRNAARGIKYGSERGGYSLKEGSPWERLEAKREGGNNSKTILMGGKELNTEKRDFR